MAIIRCRFGGLVLVRPVIRACWRVPALSATLDVVSPRRFFPFPARPVVQPEVAEKQRAAFEPATPTMIRR